MIRRNAIFEQDRDSFPESFQESTQESIFEDEEELFRRVGEEIKGPSSKTTSTLISRLQKENFDLKLRLDFYESENNLNDLKQHSYEHQHQQQQQDDLHEKYEEQIESLKSEFLVIAQKACLDLQELQDRICEKDDIILEISSKASMLEKELAIKSTNTSQCTQTITAVSSQCSASQTTSTSSSSASTQTYQKPAIILPSPHLDQKDPSPNILLEEYERNKKRWLDELKERNSLLARISQNLDVKLGTAHAGAHGPITSFSQMKKSVLEKLKILSLINQEKLTLESKVSRLETELQNQGLVSDQINALHDKIKTYKSQIHDERVKTANQLAQARNDTQRVLAELDVYKRSSGGGGYEEVYVRALEDVETITTKAAKYERRIKLARLYLEKSSVGGKDEFNWMEALRVLSMDF